MLKAALNEATPGRKARRRGGHHLLQCVEIQNLNLWLNLWLTCTSSFCAADYQAALSEGDDEDGERRSRARRGRSGVSRQGSGSGAAPRLQRGVACHRARHNIIAAAFNPLTQAQLVRLRKSRVEGGAAAEGADDDSIYHLRLPPPPLPLSWGRTITPYVPAHLRGQREMAGRCPPSRAVVPGVVR